MKILVVSATRVEIGPLLDQMGGSQSPKNAHLPTTPPYASGERHLRLGNWEFGGVRYAGHDIDVLVTGVGMVATAAWCSRVLAQTPYDLAFNFGLCGSFDRSLALGSVVHVNADRFAELGAEDDDRFVSIYELDLLGADEFPFSGGQLVNSAPPANPALRNMPAVTGITVNTAHGNERSIAEVAERCAPQVESMEGAAFMYACLISNVPFAQVRAVSNIVEKRNRSAWKLDDAIRSLGEAALNILDQA